MRRSTAQKCADGKRGRKNPLVIMCTVKRLLRSEQGLSKKKMLATALGLQYESRSDHNREHRRESTQAIPASALFTKHITAALHRDDKLFLYIYLVC